MVYAPYVYDTILGRLHLSWQRQPRDRQSTRTRISQLSTPLIRNLPLLRLLDDRRITPMTTDCTDSIGRNLRSRLATDLIRSQLQFIASLSPPSTHSARATRERCERDRCICPRTFAATSISVGVAVLADHAAFKHGQKLFEAGESGGHDREVGADCCDDGNGYTGIDRARGE